jgi:hypothetical protein
MPNDSIRWRTFRRSRNEHAAGYSGGEMMALQDQERRAVHPAAVMYAGEVEVGKLSRREFLTRSTALGMSTVASYGLLGFGAPGLLREP